MFDVIWWVGNSTFSSSLFLIAILSVYFLFLFLGAWVGLGWGRHFGGAGEVCWDAKSSVSNLTEMLLHDLNGYNSLIPCLATVLWVLWECKKPRYFSTFLSLLRGQLELS